MIELANSPDPSGVLQKDIAKNQHISLKYLDSIISSLKLKGLVVNSRGKGSGYRLSRDPKDITMLDIYTAFEQIIVIECINNMGFCDRASHNCKAKSYWNEFSREFIQLLAKKNLKQIIEETHYECVQLV
jgi:Rrf2 family protein